MSAIQRVKAWLKENLPMFTILYENKYVGMAYDHFASLNTQRQKQIILGVVGTVVSIGCLLILVSYLELWSLSNQVRYGRSMISALQEYRSSARAHSDQIKHLEANSTLTIDGELKRYLEQQSKLVGISARSIEIHDGNSETPSTGNAGNRVTKKSTTIVLDKINLLQLKAFLTSLENGRYALGTPSIRITNDATVRGYLRAEIDTVAYLFTGEAAHQ